MTAAKKLPDEPDNNESDIMQIYAKAVINSADPTVLKELREMRREISEEIDKRLFFAAMSRVQGAISQVATDASNPQTSSKYATLAALDRAIRPHYTAEGFSVQFDDEPTEHGIRIECTVTRGGWHTKHHHTVKPTTLGIKGSAVMTEIHAGASALSYGKRYTYAMAFNIAVERDDDGNAAGSLRVSTSQLDELMQIVQDRHVDTSIFCPWASERLGYQIENLSMVLRPDINRVRTWLLAKRKPEPTKGE
jgi:ERF superfamily